jgi:hypothetical protein
MEEKKNNSKITVQDWLHFFRSERQILAVSEQGYTTRLMGSVTLFIASLIAILTPQLPYRWLGWVGLAFSVVMIIFLFVVAKMYAMFVNALQNMEIAILMGELQDVNEIAEKWIKYSLDIKNRAKILKGIFKACERISNNFWKC